MGIFIRPIADVGMLHAWVGQIVLECNELRRNSLTREQCSRRASAGQQLLCPACEWHAQHACACHSRIGAALPLHLRARRLHCIHALLRVVDTCADGCFRARPEASSHQVLASVSRQHCQLVWLLPDRPALLTIWSAAGHTDVMSSQHDRSVTLLSTVQIAGGAAAGIL